MLQAYSNAAMYQAMQENRLQACEEMPIAQRAGRKAQYQTDYEGYQQARDSPGSPRKLGSPQKQASSGIVGAN